MNVSKQILLSGTVNNSINIPINLDWEYLDTETDIVAFQDKAIKELLASDKDFEVNRFAHADFQNSTEINYEFYFYEGSGLSNVNNWKIDYRAEGFTTQEIYYYANSFRNSFFKLDLYDSPLETEQTNYITIIIPTQQGERMDTLMQTTNVFIRKPKFILNYVGDKEGFFIYWLKKRNFLDISTFYMSAKFYDARTGFFLRMMNKPQSFFPNSQFTFDTTRYFYYIMKIDYPTQTYRIFDSNNVRFGQPNNPIVWYEFINP